MTVIRLTNHGALRQPPAEVSAACLSHGWWTLAMLKPIVWQLEQGQQTSPVIDRPLPLDTDPSSGAQ